ncbi:MAG TPA: hypothetical protein VLA52_03690 [Thermohalobaculum sp.]|nr:hypothetical protein [Thermohalobaculum sp.]
METQIYTLHHKGAQPLRAVEDRFRAWALFAPPIWALFSGLWLTLLAQGVLMGLVSLWSPFAVAPVFYGLAVIHGWEGGAIIRAELRLRGWSEVGVVEARSPEGAEELYLTGRTA